MFRAWWSKRGEGRSSTEINFTPVGLEFRFNSTRLNELKKYSRSKWARGGVEGARKQRGRSQQLEFFYEIERLRAGRWRTLSPVNYRLVKGEWRGRKEETTTREKIHPSWCRLVFTLSPRFFTAISNFFFSFLSIPIRRKWKWKYVQLFLSSKSVKFRLISPSQKWVLPL